MNGLRSILASASIAILLAAPCALPAQTSSDFAQPSANSIVFFDVADLPVRVDEPSFSKRERGFVIDCAVANRSAEAILGIRMILLAVDPAGKLRSRTTWNERAEIPMYSIKTFAFRLDFTNGLVDLTKDLRPTDRLFLAVEEVIGRETIWHAAEAEQALRAFAREDHEVVPAVRTFANKYDPRPGMLTLPPIRN
jgi:hypothetical protein